MVNMLTPINVKIIAYAKTSDKAIKISATVARVKIPQGAEIQDYLPLSALQRRKEGRP
jgi:hypothetical protein